ncbi:MAG: aminomethyl-transferring glycine dehydrogenase subunit GcvPA [Clostridia bacterium]|nr:aminomethyl-transferring glycine dehydrogenase subunit GcvPA [Clostridia bacterium]
MRFVPHNAADVEEMLAKIGISSTDSLFQDISSELRLKSELKLPSGLDEITLRKKITALSQENAHADEYVSFLGAGAYEHFRPALIDHLLLRSEFYTAYTPYQPEISQGTLQAIFEFQTAICELTGMDVANASMYDGATALAEAIIMACDQSKKNKVLVSSAVHPEYLEVAETYAWARGIKLVEAPYLDGLKNLAELEKNLSSEFGALVIQNPNFFGNIESLKDIIQIAQKSKVLVILCADPILLGLMEAPGKLGVDIVVGEGQSLGLPLSFGGPYLGFMATKDKYVRRMPGRIVGAAIDRRGNEGFVLTLQAREQHIRREKASSNICSNQALCALAATIYLCTLGKKGIKEVAEQCLAKAHYAKKILQEIPGVEIAFSSAKTFKEFVVKTEEPPQDINNRLLKAGIIGGLDLGRFYPELANHMLLCVTEARTKAEIELLKRVWEGEQ